MTRAKIGYLLKAFPVVSETFILNEIRAMEHHGVPLALFSLKTAPQPVEHRAVREVESPLFTAPWASLRRLPTLALAHLALLARRPGPYLATLRREVGRDCLRFLRRPTADGRKIVAKRLRRFAWAGWVAREARRRGVVHLHAHYAGEPLRVAHLVKRLVDLPYSFAAHAKDLWKAPEQRLARRLTGSRFAVACHEQGHERLRRLAAGETDLLWVRHGVDLGLFSPPAKEGREPGLILAVGRLTPKKGFDDLIRACALLAERRVDFRCEIVGDGAQRAELESLIEELGLARRVFLRGFVAQEELPEWYSRASVFALPCRVLGDGNRDGLPNVVVEAMACGLAVVASAEAGVSEIIEDGENGLLARPADPSSLARPLAQLLGDPGLARRLGAAAASSVADLDFRRTNAPLAARFESLLALPVDRALDRAEVAAWREGGIAHRASRVLGAAPARSRSVEATIRRSIRPGLEANAWRPDLERLATRRMWDEVIKGRRLERLAPLLKAGEGGAAVLDLGCGRGGLTVALRARGHAVVALDLRFRNCLVTRGRGTRYGLPVTVLTSVGERLPFAAGVFAAVSCLEVLEHVRDPAALLREIHRVLRPGGACALTLINRWAHLDPHYHLWGVNFLPRSLANRYIDLRRRSKRSYRDCQTLDDMHYFRWREFHRLVEGLGFELNDPEEPVAGWARTQHRLGRRLSLGFNSALIVLRRVEPRTPDSTYCRTTRTTRRFWARPSTVSLSATGASSP